MAEWLYLASQAQGNRNNTIQCALESNFIWRSARNINGALIPNVGHLQPGDRIWLAYRGNPILVLASGFIDSVDTPVNGTQVITRIEGPLAEEMINMGWRALNGVDGNKLAAIEGFYINEATPVKQAIDGDYPGNNTIRKLREEDLEKLTSSRDVVPPSKQVSTKEPSGKATFQAYMMVDWSASSRATRGIDSIWIATLTAEREINTHNPATRAEAMETISGILEKWESQGRKVLLGYDFTFGYPSGFAKALNQRSQMAWLATMSLIDQQVKDAANNANNRHDFASHCNQQIGGGYGPFWGCHHNFVTDTLTSQRVGLFNYPYQGLNEYRITEQRARQITTTQSAWKLNQGVSVGSQTILGLRHLFHLRSAQRQIWPFESGWQVPDAPVCICEIFPSIIEIDHSLSEVPDEAQVISMCMWAYDKDQNNELADLFHRPANLPDEQSDQCLKEEGWILGIR